MSWFSSWMIVKKAERDRVADSHDKSMWQQLFVLDPDASQSLQGQLREALVKAILDGRIPFDVPLPSSRGLARQLGIARNTVVLAYQHLVDENYLESHERRGYFVNPDILEGRVDTPRPAKRPDKVDDDADTPGPACVLDLLEQRNISQPLDWRRFEYPFIYGQTDSSLFPVNDWREASRLSLRVDAISRWTQDRVDHDDDLLVEQIHTRVLQGVNAVARRDAPGVYVGTEKIAALGLRVRRGCSYHGLALNVDADLSAFNGINPCGFAEQSVTRTLDLGIQAGKQELLAVLLEQLTLCLSEPRTNCG